MRKNFTIIDCFDNPKRRAVYFHKSECYDAISSNKFNAEKITDPSKPHVSGVGYYKFSSIEEVVDAKSSRAWSLWLGILSRCYSPNNPRIYRDVEVHKDWHCFNKFKEWHDLHYVSGWCIDKDLLSTGKRIYSEETCCFLPVAINSSIRCKSANAYEDKQGYYFVANSLRGQPMKIYLPTREECIRASLLYKQAHMRGIINAYYKQFCPLDIDRIVDALFRLYDTDGMKTLKTVIKFEK